MVLRHLERRDVDARAVNRALDLLDLRVREPRGVERRSRRGAEDHVIEPRFAREREVGFRVGAKNAEPPLPFAMLAALRLGGGSGGERSKKRTAGESE